MLSIKSPENYGARLHINGNIAWNLQSKFPTVIDVETDEADNFVGIALTQGTHVYYSTRLSEVKWFLEETQLIGHNLKGDIKWLINWGVNLKSEQMYYDTILASYVHNTTKESHGLKDLAKEILGMEWPTYKEMVGSGKKKQTLDKQPVERVAAYCGLDCLATFRLYEHFKKTLTKQETKYLEEIELPTARALLDMELRGVQVDVKYLKELDQQFLTELDSLNKQLLNITSGRDWKKLVTTKSIPKAFNPNSGFHVAALLQTYGVILPKTKKGRFKTDKNTLSSLTYIEPVTILQRFSEIETLQSTFTSGLIEKQKNGRVHGNFNQISKDDDGNDFGISTGRLSSSGPNLQNIPARTKDGQLILKGFISGPSKIFVHADFSQIEPSMAGHISKDKFLLEIYREGRDLYEELIRNTGRERQDGKTFFLAGAMYGAQSKKLASIFKCSEPEALKINSKIMGKMSGFVAWINRVKYEAHQKGGVKTLFGRWVPLPKINSKDRYERLHWERVAVNTIIQGSSAEIIKKVLIELHRRGHSTVLTVHDSVLIEVEIGFENDFVIELKTLMENIVKLEVPLKVDVGIGSTWKEAKE